MSYLLFDGGFASQLIELAMEDAHARREELVEFFAERSQDAASASSDPVNGPAGTRASD